MNLVLLQFDVVCRVWFSRAGQKRSKAAKGTALTHILVDPEAECWSKDNSVIPVLHGQGSLDFGKPFIMSMGSEGGLQEATLSKRLAEFVAVFKDSNLRVTEGRAHMPIELTLAEPFLWRFCQELVKEMDKATADQTSVRLLEEKQAQYADLAKVMGASSFGIAGSHVSIGKFELSQFPCLRINSSGTRFVSIILLDGLLEALPKETSPSLQAMQEFAFQASLQQLQDLVAKKAAYAGTIGPNDALYLPPGAIVSHRVQSSDCIGLRTGIIGPMMLEAFKKIQTMHVSNAVQQAIAFLEELPPAPGAPRSPRARTPTPPRAEPDDPPQPEG